MLIIRPQAQGSACPRQAALRYARTDTQHPVPGAGGTHTLVLGLVCLEENFYIDSQKVIEDATTTTKKTLKLCSQGK